MCRSRVLLRQILIPHWTEEVGQNCHSLPLFSSSADRSRRSEMTTVPEKLKRRHCKPCLRLLRGTRRVKQPVEGTNRNAGPSHILHGSRELFRRNYDTSRPVAGVSTLSHWRGAITLYEPLCNTRPLPFKILSVISLHPSKIG